MNAPLDLTFACGPYDRMAALFDGRVSIDGVTLRTQKIANPMEIFSRMLARDDFDVAEMSLTHCYVLQATGAARFVTLPVFPSRMFRHSFIFVKSDRGIQTAQDLAGKRIGVQGFQMTAAVWIRGILREDYGVDLDDVTWYEGGVNEAGVAGGDATRLRPNERDVRIEAIPSDRTLSGMLESGEIDALIGAVTPESLGRSGVVRLFPDYHRIERESYLATRVYPIMHALVMRRQLYEREPWLAQTLYDACDRAKTIALHEMRFSAALRYMLPWLLESVEENDRLFDSDPWPYGFEKNAPTLSAFGRHLAADGFLLEAPPREKIFIDPASAG